MKTRRVRLLVVCGGIALLIAAAAVGVALRLHYIAGARAITLNLVHDVDDPVTLRALDEVLHTYSSLYTTVHVVRTLLPPHADVAAVTARGADVLMRSGPETSAESPYAEPPVPWSGTLWVIAARKDYLDAAAGRQKDAVSALREGNATPEQFEALLADAAANGLEPITMGNSFKWPFVLWLQHWAAATKGPNVADAIPAPPTEGGKDAYADLRDAFADLMNWKANGWFDKSVWDEGWARGLAPLDQGKAAFGLVSTKNLPAISPKGRAALEYLPFPHRTQDSAWSVGLATYLGIGKTTREVAAARRLVQFLTSPGITSRLSELTGRPFFAWDPKTRLSPRVLPDWSAAAMSPAYDALAKEFDPGG